MKIEDRHLYYGAALMQLLDHRQAMFVTPIKDSNSIRNVFTINRKIAVCMKYASEPKGPNKAYPFTFTSVYIDEVNSLDFRGGIYFALICRKDNEICWLALDQLNELIKRRKEDVQDREDQYTIHAKLQDRSEFRVYIDKSKTKRTSLGPDIQIRDDDSRVALMAPTTDTIIILSKMQSDELRAMRSAL